MLQSLMMLAGVSKADENKINTVIDELLKIPAALHRIETKLDHILSGRPFNVIEGQATNDDQHGGANISG